METNENLAMSVARGTIYLTLGSIIGYVISFFYRIFVARYLGPTEYGILSIFLMLVGLSSVLFSIGLGTTATKFISEYKSMRKDYNIIFSNGLIITVVMGAIASLLLFSLAEVFAVGVFHNVALIPYLKLGSAATFFIMLHNFLMGSYIGLNRIKESAIVGVAEKTVKFITTVLLFTLGYGLTGAVFGYIAGFLISSIIFLGFGFTKNYFSFVRFNKFVMNRIVLFGVPVFFWGIAGTIVAWTDTFFIGYLLNATHVGIYNAVLPILWMLGAMIVSLSTALLPAFSGIGALKNNVIIGDLLNRSLRYSLILLIPLSVGAIYLSTQLVYIVFGIEYLAAASPFRILALGALFLSLNSILSSFLVGTRRPKIVMYVTFITLVINIILNWTLIQLYGINGAAIATTVSFLSAFLLYVHIVRKLVPLKFSYVYKPIISSVAMLLFLMVISTFIDSTIYDIPIKIFSGAVLYFAVMFLMGGLNKSDINSFKRIFKL